MSTSWHNVIDWQVGQLVTAAQLNEQLRDNLQFLRRPLACRVYNDAAIAVPMATDVVLVFNSEDFDTGGLHDTTVNPGRLTAPLAGLYIFTALATFDPNTSGNRALSLRLNGTTVIAQDTVLPAVSSDRSRIVLSAVYRLAVGDYMEAVVRQTSGGALNIVAVPGVSPEFRAVYLGEVA